MLRETEPIVTGINTLISIVKGNPAHALIDICAKMNFGKKQMNKGSPEFEQCVHFMPVNHNDRF